MAPTVGRSVTAWGWALDVRNELPIAPTVQGDSPGTMNSRLFMFLSPFRAYYISLRMNLSINKGSNNLSIHELSLINFFSRCRVVYNGLLTRSFPIPASSFVGFNPSISAEPESTPRRRCALVSGLRCRYPLPQKPLRLSVARKFLRRE